MRITPQLFEAIDWTDARDVVSHQFTVMQMAAIHAPLREALENDPDLKRRVTPLFLDGDSISEEERDVFQDRLSVVGEWISHGLLRSIHGSLRYCRHCHSQEHTRTYCPIKSDPPSSSTSVPTAALAESQPIPVTQGKCKAKYLLHMQSLERQRLILEKEGSKSDAAASDAASKKRGQQGNIRNQTVGAGTEATASQNAPQFASEERRRGVVTRLDLERGIGFVAVSDFGEVRFFLDRTDYGVKEPAVNDMVTLKIDTSRDVPTAVEVRPDRSNLTVTDVTNFIERCRVAPVPIKMIETILMQRHEWSFVVATLAQSMPSRASKIAAINVLVALTTFVTNREPIHLRLLQNFLNVMTDRVPMQSVSGLTAFFPDLIIDVIQESPRSVFATLNSRRQELGSDSLMIHPTVGCEEWISERLRYLDGLMEIAQLVLLQRQHATTPESVIRAVADPLAAALEMLSSDIAAALSSDSSETTPTFVASAKIALRRCQLALNNTTGNAAILKQLRSAIFPSAEELSIPPNMPTSAFHHSNLPKIGLQSRYDSAQDLVMAQCKLLRADTFEATARVLVAGCFQLPDVDIPDETKQDLQHCHMVQNVRFMGRVPTRDRDFSVPDTYLFSCEAKPETKTNLRSHFATGSCVCITTGLDRTKIEPEELFWGVVSSADKLLLQTGVLAISPCDGSDFTTLIENLQRNSDKGASERCSLMLETPLFLTGYQGVVAALLSFVGPAAMPFPMASTIVDQGKTCANSSAAATSAVGYIPPHARFAFERLVEDVCQTFTLDKGQEEAMRSLATKDVVLVQGPPGTGKSFIGARVVEVYIRYKQLMASGDILNTVDVDALKTVRWDRLVPKMGPVVVITYKNHALDEFLIDLMNSGLWNSERHRIVHTAAGTTKLDVFPRGQRIVRVGGRSREASLQDYNLNVLMQGRADKSSVNMFRDRIYLMFNRLEKLAKEILLLEHGRVPKAYFDKWLTEEQRATIRYEDRDEWLSGAKFAGMKSELEPVDANFYLTILRSQLSARLAGAQKPESPTAAGAGAFPTDIHASDEDIQLSVFREMQREDDSRETNDNLRNIFISAEALAAGRASSLPMPDGVPQPMSSLWSMSHRMRHVYYAHLILVAIAAKAKDWVKVMDAMQNTITLRNHALEEARLDLLQGADIIGFTTTGCAMHQNLLRALRPSLLVVEEAAEVLESQLLACLTDSLKQIVLIGDHYQLKPKVETFSYEKHNHLNISLFERLAHVTKPIRLVEQRRMHPMISALIRPFYDGQAIEDHSSVLQRPFVDAAGSKRTNGIPGLGDLRLFMWDHSHPEETAPNSLSKINRLELSMCVHLVEHLVDEGVHPRSITLITPYLGQCRALRNALRLRPSSQLRDIRVSTVDLFQGDESDVIILSMVRTQKLTEFLRMRNRMIVSCSRARFAFVIVGNSTLLEQSPHWREVLAMLKKVQCIGESIPLDFGGKLVHVKNNEWPRDVQRGRRELAADMKDEWLDDAAEAAATLA